MARFRFKLLAGSHHIGTLESGKHFRSDGGGEGNIIDTDQDLRADDPLGQKFQLVSDGGRAEGEPSKAAPLTDRSIARPQRSSLPNLDAMSEKALKDFAAAEEIDLGDAKGKPAMIAAIREAHAKG